MPIGISCILLWKEVDIMKNIFSYLGVLPTIDDSVYIAESANIIGRVILKKNASVWHQTSIRGDINTIEIGEGTNIQEQTVIHVSTDTGVKLGNNVTVGHGCIIHGCTILDYVIVGMGSTVLDGAVIGNNCIIGANSLVTKDKVFEDGMLILGSPAKAIRPLSAEEIESIQLSAENYMHEARLYSDEQKIRHNEVDL